MTNSKYSEFDGNKEMETVEPVINYSPPEEYITQFFIHLNQYTGLKLSSFTSAGLSKSIKTITKNCYQFNICGEVLECLFKLVKEFMKHESPDVKNIDKILTSFVHVMIIIMKSLAYVSIGSKVVTLTAGLSSGIGAVVICGFHALMFILDCFGTNVLISLKDWIVCIIGKTIPTHLSKKVITFLQEVLSIFNQARAIHAA